MNAIGSSREGFAPLKYLGIKNPEVGMEIELDFYWNDIFNTSGTGMQNFLLSGYFTEYQNQTSGASVAFISEKSMEKNGLQWEPCRILIDHTKKYSSGSQIEHMLTNNIKLNEGQRIVSMNPAEYRAISEMMGSYGFAVFFSVMVLLSMFLFIYNILNISLEKDLQRYGLLQVIGVEQKQNIKVMNREMLKIGLTGSIAGAVLGGMFIWGIMPLLLEKMYAENTWKLERMVFFQPKLLILAIVLVIFTLGVAVECLKRKMRKLSPLECMKYTEAVTYHKSRKKPKIKKFRCWGKHPEIYLAKKYLFRNKKTFGITSLSLWHPGVGAEGLHIPPLPLGIDGVKGQGGLARAGQPREHHQLVSGDAHVDVLQVVHPRAFHCDMSVHWSSPFPRQGSRFDLSNRGQFCQRQQIAEQGRPGQQQHGHQGGRHRNVRGLGLLPVLHQPVHPCLEQLLVKQHIQHGKDGQGRGFDIVGPAPPLVQLGPHDRLDDGGQLGLVDGMSGHLACKPDDLPGGGGGIDARCPIVIVGAVLPHQTSGPIII